MYETILLWSDVTKAAWARFWCTQHDHHDSGHGRRLILPRKIWIFQLACTVVVVRAKTLLWLSNTWAAFHFHHSLKKYHLTTGRFNYKFVFRVHFELSWRFGDQQYRIREVSISASEYLRWISHIRFSGYWLAYTVDFLFYCEILMF